MPTTELWEATLSIRDSVFAQVFILAVLAFIVYRLTKKFIWRMVIIGVGIALFVLLYGGSLANIAFNRW